VPCVARETKKLIKIINFSAFVTHPGFIKKIYQPIRFSRLASLKYIEKRLYFSLPSQDKCLEFMIF